MTDIELLELAAKAAGLNLAEYREERNSMYFPFPSELTDGHWWNPLTDDGDALRLAVSLGLCVMFDRDSVQVSYSDGGEYCKAFALEPINSSEQATRRAIARAASETTFLATPSQTQTRY